MRTFITCLVLLSASLQVAAAADVYVVSLHSREDADLLGDVRGDAVLRAGNRYIVAGTPATPTDLRHYGLDYELLATDVELSQLAVDRRIDDVNLTRHELLFEHEGIRLLRLSGDRPVIPGDPDLLPLPARLRRIVFADPRPPARRVQPAADLDSLVGLVQQDSVTSYLDTLQAFYRRVAGTASNYAARDWLVGKFEQFGYDSLYLDPFEEYFQGAVQQCYNVVAVKPGSVYPGIQIVVGAHFDGVVGSPAADDNGTGTVAVLELARVLADFETAVTIVFIAFDAEEWGLYGSWHYSDGAVARDDTILFMFNMDMIGHYTNDLQAKLYHGANKRFAQSWIDIAPPWSNITGALSGSTGRSDHYPFIQNGYDGVFLQEYNFSTVYHTSRDSTTYINFDYFTRMIKGTAATVYSLSESDDLDADGVPNDSDNCFLVANATQSDTDTDGWGDLCDNCPDNYNPDQADADYDRIGDLCDACMYDPENDADEDGTCADVDNCPHVYNPDQFDKDGNGVGDACQFTPPAVILTGAEAYDSLGFRVAAGGDVNNDGYADLIVGAPGVGPTNAGEAYVYSGLDASLLFVITGESANANLGSAVAIVPDLSGDGYDDMVVGAPMNGDIAFAGGRTHVVLGGPGPFPQTIDVDTAYRTFAGSEIADFEGAAVCAIGDVDGDSVTDLAVSRAQLLGTVGSGHVTVYSGASLSALYTLDGENVYDWFGHDIDAAGDFNNDGQPDLLVGAPHYAAGSDRGRVYVFSGPDGTLIAEFTGDSTRGQLGFSVAGLGDINGDGWDDIAAGAPYDERNGLWTGYACVYSGKDSTLLYTYFGHTDGDGTGAAVTGVGDVDGDSRPEFAVAGWQRGFDSYGRVDLYSGADGSVIHTFIGEEPNSGFGIDIGARWNAGGDGSYELIVGAFIKDMDVLDVGRVYIFPLGDPDQDGLTVGYDNCPAVYNPGQADYDGDGSGDACDACPAYVTPNGVGVITGDWNADGYITASDVLYLARYVFKGGGSAHPIAEAGDTNCSGDITAADIVYLVNVVFKAGPAPCDVCAVTP